MVDPSKDRAASPERSPETAPATDTENGEDASIDNLDSTTAAAVDGADVKTTSFSASDDREVKGVSYAALESGVNEDTSNSGLKSTTASDEPSKSDHSDSIATTQEGTPPSRGLREELAELREQLADLAEQAHRDREERHRLERALQEETLYPIPIPTLSGMERQRPKRVRWLDGNFGSGDDFDDELMMISSDEHKSRMETMFRRELKYIEKDRMVFREFKKTVEGLEEQQQLWSEERKVLEAAIAEERERARRTDSRSPASRGEEAIPGVETDPIAENQETDMPPTPPNHAIAMLSYIPWDVFKAMPLAKLEKEEHQCHAIEVLVGEPDISFDSMAYRNLWWRNSANYRGNKELKMPAAERRGQTVITKKTAGGTQIPGQAPVAERIRINSTHIIKILEKIHGESLASTEGSVVMIRPFRALVYYSEQIRQTFQELEAKFAITLETSATANDIGRGVTDPTNDVGHSGAGEIETTDARRPATDEEEQEKTDVDEYTTSALAYQQMQVLMDFLNAEIKNKLEYLASDDCQKITFADLWYLFRPGDEVISRALQQAFRVIEVTSPPHKAVPPWRTFNTPTESEETPVTVKCVYIDFDGKQLGPVTLDFNIKRFDGEKLVTTLDVFPLRFIKEDVRGKPGKRHKRTLRRRLIERGLMFLDVAKVKHMHYNGHTIDARDEVDSQVVVDFAEAFSKPENDWKVVFSSMIESTEEEKTEEDSCSEACCSNDNIHEDSYAETRRKDDFIAGLIPQDKSTEPPVSIFPRNLADIRNPYKTILDDDLLIMSYRVFGYVLRSRKWERLDLQFLSDIGARSKRLDEDDEDDEDEDDEDEDGDGGGHSRRQDEVAGDGTGGQVDEEETAFDQLVLPDGHHKMVKSLVAQHFRDKEAATAQTEQADVVRGKGKGLIILLHGAPGVGKTTTAEGIAELFKKPLFQMTCGDLGTTASEVEQALETHFALASRWGCILLLDEADVFLAARTPQDFIRNGLVAVFLRVLEYYSGILFLTTNRIGTFDEAFASRIHISLHYPQLDLKSTLAVFRLNMKLIRKRFAKKKREIDIKEQEILAYAEAYWEKNEQMRWNGRQIRNACQTALALAEFDAQGGDHKKIIDKHAKVALTLEQLDVVAKAYREFIQYLDDVYDRDSETRAKILRIRAREGKKRKVSDRRLLGRRLPNREEKHQEEGWESAGETLEDDKGKAKRKTSKEGDKKQAGAASALHRISEEALPLPQQASQQDAPVGSPHGPAYGMPPSGYMGPMYYQQGYGQPPPPGGLGQVPRVEGQNVNHPGWGGWPYPPAYAYGTMHGGPAPPPQPPERK